MVDLITSNLRLFIALSGAIVVVARYWKHIFRYIKNKWIFHKRLKDVPCKIDKIEESLEEIKSCLGPNSGSSIYDKVNFLVADRIRNIRSLPYPAFECNEEGINTAVSDAYRVLAGNLKEEDLQNKEWVNFIAEEEREDHIKDFMNAVKNKRSFSRTTGFQNPITAEYRGKWHISSKRIPMGSTAIYSAKLTPADTLARSIALKNGWDGDVLGDDPDEMSLIIQKLSELIDDGKSIAFPIFSPEGLEVWIPIGEEKTEVMPRCYIWLVERKVNETILLMNCLGGVTFPLHTHPYDETVEVLSGRMLDIQKNKEYKSGEAWHIPAGEVHGATMYNASICLRIKKALPLAQRSNIDMENVRLLIENV